MSQGTLKKSPSTSTSHRPNAKPSTLPKKGKRTIAPKRKNLIKQNRITKKYSAGLINKTEKGLAEKVGHLEMLEGSKRHGKVGWKEKGQGKK